MIKIIIKGLSFWMAFALIVISFAGEVKASELQKQSVQMETEFGEDSEEFLEEIVEDVKKEQVIEVDEKINVCVNDIYFIDAKTNGDGQITYESLCPEIAEVDEKGQITAKASGEAVVVINVSETDTFYAGETKVVVNVGKRDWNVFIDDVEMLYGDSPKQLVFENPTGNTPVFEIKNTKIAKIDADGNITPVRIGETSVLISVRGNEEYQDFSCKIKIQIKTNLSKPVLLEASGQDGKITLRWEKVEGADGYYIYRKNSEGEYKKIHTIKDSDVLEYAIEDVKESQKYTYKIRGYTDGGKNYSSISNAKTGICMIAPKLELKRISNTVIVNWTKVPEASGYYISRKTKKNNEWEVVAKISSGSTVTWTDKSPKHGWKNLYCVNAYYSTSMGEKSENKALYFLKRSSVNRVSRKNTSMTVEWSRNSIASGYELQYADNCLFYNPKSVKIKGNTVLNKRIKFLSRTKTYYVRIRAYKAYTSCTYYSDWAYSSNVTQTKNATYKLLKYKKKTFELKDQAKQYIGGYDTVQGGCTDGKYAYYAMNNRKVEKCRIVKVRLSDMKVMKVSSILEIAHGNDMTYNPDTKKIVVTHTKVNMKRLSIINPSTLKREKTFDVTIPKDLPGLKESDYKKIVGFSGIEYNANRKQYILYLKNTGDFLILDKNFKPVTYVVLSYKTSVVKQGIDATKDFILTYHSGTTNFFRVYTWEGKYITRINVKKGYELENIYHVGGQYYATFYYSYYKKEKLQRDNYVYKISGF